MSSVKTYLKVNKEKESATFSISKMEDIYTKRDGVVDEPHRHNYYTVVTIYEINF